MYMILQIQQKMTEEIQSSDIFANATIVGMKPMDDQSVVKDMSAFRPGLVVADAVYNPEETKLLREAKEQDAPASVEKACYYGRVLQHLNCTQARICRWKM